MRTTFHLVPLDARAVAESGFDAGAPYAAASLATEGFIHCTDGVEALGATFYRFYAADQRTFNALTVDLDALDVAWRFDDPGKPYPHIYGAIRREAVVGVSRVERTADGRFKSLAPA